MTTTIARPLLLADLRVGDRVRITKTAGGVEHTLTATVGALHPIPAIADGFWTPEHAWIGVRDTDTIEVTR